MQKLNFKTLLICCLCFAGISCSGQPAQSLNQTDLGLMPVKSGGKWTYLNPDGKYVFDRMFEDANWYSEGLALVKSGGKWGYINLEGEYAIKLQFEEAQSFQDGLASVKSGGKWGYINSKGEYAIAPQFKEANSFQGGLAQVKEANGKAGYIGKDGKYVIAAEYQDGTDFLNGQAFVLSANGAVVCIDKTGNAKFTLEQAQYVFGYSEGFTMFLTTGGKIKYVNKSGKVVFENNCYDNGICCVLNAYGFKDGMLLIYHNDKYSFISKTGEFISPQFDYVRDFSEGLAVAKLNGIYGFIDKTYKFVISPQFNSARDFSKGLAAVELNGIYGFIDKTGKFVISPQFDYVSDFSEGLAAVRVKNGKWGFIDKTGKFVISPQFEIAHNFSEGLAEVLATSPNRKYYYIDKTGKVVNPPQKTDKVAAKYSEGLAKSKSGNKWGFIDKEGNFVIRPEYDDALDFSEGLAAVKLNGKWGYININYGVAIKPQFDYAQSFHGGVADVGDNARQEEEDVSSIYINKRGEVIGSTIIGDNPHIHYLPNGITVVSGESGGYNLVSAIAAGTIAKVDDIKYLPSAKDYYGNGMDYADWDYLFSVGNGKLKNAYVSVRDCQ